MRMSLIFRNASAVENEVAIFFSVAKRSLGTSPSWTLRNRERRQCTGWSSKDVSRTNRSITSYRLNESKQRGHVLISLENAVSRTAGHSMNTDQNFSRCIQRLFTTTKNDLEEKEKNNTNSIGKTLQMPDKDTELKLADLQATITEEYKRGNFTKALSSSQELLKQTQQHFGYNVDHPATASAMNNVGLMHKLLGNFTEARQHYVGSMRIYASVCGRDHASYAMTLHNLGNLNKSQVHFDASLKATERLTLVEAAMEYLEEAYAIRIAELGAEHPHTVATRSAIGSTLAAQVLYQHKLVEETKSKSSDDDSARNSNRKQYVALDPQGITQQQWRAAEEHLRISLQTAIENPRGTQIKNKKNRNNQRSKQFVKQQLSSDASNADPSSGIIVTTLSAASAAQNLAVFLKSLAMTFDEDSQLRKQHIYEAKDLYEKVQQARTQLLPYDHPDLYATKYSLSELLQVLASTSSSSEGDKGGDEEEQKRQRYQEAANALRQEIIDTYDPPDLQQEEQVLDSEKKSEPIDVVVVEKTIGSQK